MCSVSQAGISPRPGVDPWGYGIRSAGEASSYKVTDVREQEWVPETESSGEVMKVGEW